MRNIIFHLVLTKQCNKRCEYCDLNFENRIITKNTIDKFIIFINKNSHKYGEIRINFFGGEPLLEFETIHYVLDKINKKNIFYSIGTNGTLLSAEKYGILQKYNVQIIYSVDTETYTSVLKQDYIDFPDKNFHVNLILNPRTILHSFRIFELLVNKGIKHFSILPVYATIDWDKQSLILLNTFILKLNETSELNLEALSYYDKPTSDIEYIIEPEGDIYLDIHTHFWFLKQYKSTPKDILEIIEKESYLGNMDDIANLVEEIQFCKYKNIYKISLQAPRLINSEENFLVIDKILKKLNN